MRRQLRRQRRRPPLLLADFGLRERARVIGALGLWPGLADRWEAMQALAGASRSEITRGRHLSRRQLALWLNGTEGRSLQRFVPDGVYDGEWVCEAIVDARRVELLGGRVARPRQLVGVVADALASLEETEWAQEALQGFKAALQAGQLVAERAGLAAATLADHAAGGEITLPDAQLLSRLAAAVTLDGRQLRGDGVDLAHLAPLKHLLTSRLSPRAAAESVVARPLSGIGSELILLAPSQLTSAALDRVCAASEAAEAFDVLLEQVEIVTQARVDRLLRLLGYRSEGRWSDGGRLFRFDTDKLACVATVCGARAANVWSAQAELDRVVEEFRRAQRLDRQICLAIAVTVSAAGYPEYSVAGDAELLVLGLDELEVVADAHRREPLLLWRLRAQRDLFALAGRSDIGFLDVLGHADRLYKTSRIIVSPDPAFDAAEELLRRGLERSGRRVAPDPDVADHSVTVVRADAGDHVFERVDGGGERIELFVSCHGQQGWVRAPSRLTRSEPEGAIAHLAASCLSTIWERVEFLGLKRPERWLLEIEWDDDQADELQVGRILAAVQLPVTRLTIGPAFLQTVARVDNDGDRQVARATLEGWLTACGADAAAATAAAHAVEITMPLGPGSLLVWPAHDTPRLPERLPPAPQISSACAYLVRSEIADHVRRRYAPGLYEDDSAKEILNFAVSICMQTVGAELSGLGPSEVRGLVAFHERAVTDELYRGLTLPARAGLFGRELAIEEYVAGVTQEARATLGLRFLVEHATARPPEGTHQLSEAALERLRMLVDFLLDAGGLSDALWLGLTTARMIVPEAGPLAIHTSDELHRAQHAQISAFSADAPERHHTLARQMFRALAPSDADLDARGDPFDEAWKEAYGFSHVEMAKACAELIAIAYDQPDGVMALPENAAVRLASEGAGVAPEATRKAIASLTLKPPGNYDPLASAYRPWRLRRDWSLAARPIVRWASLNGTQLLWSAESLSKSGLYRARMNLSARRSDDPAIRAAAQRTRRLRDLEFNDEVAAALTLIEGAKVRARVRKIGGRRLFQNGVQVGDVDVLAVVPTAGYVLALEVKNFLPSLHAFAIDGERRRLEAPGGAIEQNMRVLEWLSQNEDAISAEFGAPDAGGWLIEGAVVVPSPLATSFLPGIATRILAVSEVADWLRGRIGEAACGPNSGR
jgi:hypothetical protein